MKGKKIELTDKEVAYLSKHFKHMKNAELAAKLNIGERSVVRLARKLGLTKTAQFMRRCEDGRFKKGVTPEQRLGKRKNAERIRKAVESRAKTWKSERARATFGLPQRTKLPVIPQPKKKVELRYYLKRCGYIVDDVARVAYYDENTRRGKRIEEKPQRWYKFQSIEQRAV